MPLKIKAYAEKLIPAIKHHLTMAKKIQKGLEDKTTR